MSLSHLNKTIHCKNEAKFAYLKNRKTRYNVRCWELALVFSLSMFAKKCLLSRIHDFSLMFRNRLVLLHHTLMVMAKLEKYMPLERWCVTNMNYSKSSQLFIDEGCASSILIFLTFTYLTLVVLVLKSPYQNVNEICFYFLILSLPLMYEHGNLRTLEMSWFTWEPVFFPKF